MSAFRSRALSGVPGRMRLFEAVGKEKKNGGKKKYKHKFVLGSAALSIPKMSSRGVAVKFFFIRYQIE